MQLVLGNVKFRYQNEVTNKIEIVPGNITKEADRLLINFRYHEKLKDEIKILESPKWHGYEEPPRKIWSVKDNQANRFQLSYLTGLNPYAPYDCPLIEFTPKRNILYNHQIETAAFEITRRQCIISEEVGVGKTLATFEAAEFANKLDSSIRECIWVGPGSALDSVRYEQYRWKPSINIIFMTYEELKKYYVKLVESINGNSNGIRQYAIPKFIVFDECHLIKNPTSQRSQAAAGIADLMREVYGRDCYIILMSGTPAPKDPTDWWHPARVACPGFLREGTVNKFKDRLALVEEYEGLGGQKFPKLKTWYDDPNKCKSCGKYKDDPDHDLVNLCESFYHPFEQSIDEVSNLYKRLFGLTIVKFKKGLLDLPEIQFNIKKVKPNDSTLRAANLISKTAGSAIKVLTLIRELSDGFQYIETENGTETCPSCNGLLKTKMMVDADDPDNPLDSESLTRGHRAIWGEEQGLIIGYKEEPLKLIEQLIDCEQCNGKGKVKAYTRTASRVPCPKDEKVLELLERYEEEGRAVIWAGFTDSIDRNIENCMKNDWPVIRLDGRGWWSTYSEINSLGKKENIGLEMLKAFDDKNKYPRIAFIGQQGAGGMGINLTASSFAVFFSNTFKSNERDQAVGRIHRPGADHNRGCNIFDLVHLPQDLLMIKSLNRKRDLQQLSMGMLKVEIEKAQLEFERML